MSTRAQIRFATRQAGQSFNEHPDAIHTQIYHHYDGYPEYLGVRLFFNQSDDYKITLNLITGTKRNKV